MSKKKRNQSTDNRKGISGVTFVKSKKYITEYTLKNNEMSILYVHVPGSPTVTSNIVYHVGSQHETMGETGLAHMLEHMLFKPTTTKSLSWKDLEEKGALLNATTWLDRTMYYFNLPTEYFEQMLQVEADRMRNVILDDTEFLPERTNVLSEYEMYNSKPDAVLEWNMISTAFHAHGYKHETIGFKSDIEAYTTEKLQNFYNKYYWPNNATLIVVGDLEEKQMLTSIKKIFGGIPKKQLPTNVATPEAEQEGERRVVLERKTPIRVCNIAFKAPAFTHDDWIPLYLALNYLAGDSTSPLYKALVETNLATSVGRYIHPTKDSFLGFIEVFAAENSSYVEIEKIVFEVIETFKKTKVSKTNLKALTSEAHAQELFSRDGTFSLAGNLAEYVATGNWEHFFDGLTQITETSATDLQTVARKYLNHRSATIGTIENPS